jgi:hypothetical protein
MVGEQSPTNMPMTQIERECRFEWLRAMDEMLRSPFIGFRSEREALRRAYGLLFCELARRTQWI